MSKRNFPGFRPSTTQRIIPPLTKFFVIVAENFIDVTTDEAKASELAVAHNTDIRIVLSSQTADELKLSYR